MRIGIDFDNTIADYDHAFFSLAVEWGMVPQGVSLNKTEVRETLRARDGGEIEWQRLQGRVYGAEIDRAELIDGVGDFLMEARQRGDEIYIVSHKSEFGHFDPDLINLRDAAREWMSGKGLFSDDGYAINLNRVYFLSERDEKVSKIAELSLDWFIDDLPEVLDDENFPDSVEKVLFTNNSAIVDRVYAVMPQWADIQALIYS